MKLKFIGLAAALWAVSFSNAMENSQPVNNAIENKKSKKSDKDYEVKIEEKNGTVNVTLNVFKKNGLLDQSTGNYYGTKKTKHTVNLPKQLPIKIENSHLKEIEEFSKIFKYLEKCFGEKNKVLDAALDYERQLINRTADERFTKFKSSLWTNYFTACNKKYVDLYKLSNHLIWKTTNAVNALEVASKGYDQAEKDACKRRANRALNRLLNCVLMINNVQQNKIRVIDKAFYSTVKSEYTNLSIRFSEFAETTEADKATSVILEKMKSVTKFRNSLDSTKKTKKRSNSSGSSSDEKKSEKRSSDSDNNNNNKK